MLLHLDHYPASRPAIIDSDGGTVTYGQIVEKAETYRQQYPQRTLCFLLVENTVASALAIMAALASRQLVPLILNAHIEPSLLQNLIQTYHPHSIIRPEAENKEKNDNIQLSEEVKVNLHPLL